MLLPRVKQAIARHEHVLVLLDGTAGYATSFLEEAFGGLVRNLHRRVSSLVEVVSENPSRKREVESYIQDEELKLA